MMLNLPSHIRSPKLFYVFLGVLVCLFFVQSVLLLKATKAKSASFFKFHGRYDLIRDNEVLIEEKAHTDPVTGQKGVLHRQFKATAPFEAAQWLPEDATVEVFPRVWALTKNMARYVLFPRKVDYQGGYVLDIHENLIDIPVAFKKKVLPSGGLLYAKPGFDFIPQKRTVPPAWPSLLLRFLLICACYLASGFFVCSLLHINPRSGGILWFISLSYLCGMLVLNGTVWLSAMAGLPYNRTTIIGSWAIVLLSLWIKSRKCVLPLEASVQQAWSQLKEDLRNKTALFIHLLILGLLAALFVSVIFSPLLDWDGMLHWAYTAKIFAHEGKIAFAYPYLSYYPLLWPFHIANYFVLLDSNYDGIVVWLMAVNFLLFMTQFNGCVKILHLPKDLSWLPIMLYLSNYYTILFYFSYAEIIFVCYALAMAGALLLWIKDDKTDRFLFVLALLMSCGLSLVKLEGWFTAVFIAGAGIFVQRKALQGRELHRNIMLLGIPAVLLAGWIFWVKWQGHLIPISHIEKGLTVNKLLLYWKVLSNYILSSPHRTTVILCITLITILLRKTPWNKASCFLWIASLCLVIFGYLSVLGVHNERLTEQITRATPRLVFHAAPLFCLWWASMFVDA